MGEPNPSDSPEEERQKLLRLAMQGKWKEVISHYKTYPDLQDKPLTRAGDTALHVAISAGDEDTVIELLAVLKGIGAAINRIVTKKNDDGLTPIQLAATLDMDRACWEMARLCPDLVKNVRNKKGETPLFTAVRHGNKKAFFALEMSLQKVWPDPSPENMERDVTHCRRSDGNNILHIAIYGEYFDLAYQIIYLYPRLVNYVNERGESPFHYLANKPSSFRSGTSFNLFDQIIYSCILVGPIKTKIWQRASDYAYDDDPIVPETWDTICQVFTFIKPIFATIIPKRIRMKQAMSDEENPGEGQQEPSEVSARSQQEPSEEEKQKLPFPKIYEVGLVLFKIVIKILLVILGIGLRRTQTLEKMKRKHNHAYQLMNELVKRSKIWEYEKKGGMDIDISSSDLLWEPPADETSTDQNLPTQQGQLDLVSKNLKPESSKMVASCGGILLAKITAPEYPRNKQVGIKLNLRILDKQKIIYGDIYVPEEEAPNEPDKVTPVLIAAKNGITEMVKKILDSFPMAVWDMDKDEKNIMLLAVEYRQIHMYEFMNKRKIMNDSVFRKVDKNRNTALHLAAKLSTQKLPWDLGRAALRMEWDVKWYKYVMHSREPQFFTTWNSEGETAQEIFSKEHNDLVKDAGKWMQETSQSFSVVAALIASVVFASATTFPGGTNQDSGLPILSDEFPFKVFTVSAFIAFCFSVASLLTFLNIITSPHRAEDFEKSLPGKLLIGLTSLFTAIAAMLVAFCAGNLLAMEKKSQSMTLVIYGITCFLVLSFAFVEFPLYVYLFKATLNSSPMKVAQTTLNTF